MGRPESASIAGAILVFVVFALAAGDSGMFALDGVINWAVVSAYLGIVATGACLLMIAGEFDLSLGSMIGFTGMMAAIHRSSSAGRSGFRCSWPSAARSSSAGSTERWW